MPEQRHKDAYIFLMSKSIPEPVFLIDGYFKVKSLKKIERERSITHFVPFQLI